MKFPNLEVRIFLEAGFHPKGYLFYGDEKVSCLVGSSNLTQSALKTNQEWNISFANGPDSDIIQDITSQFERQWHKSVPLNQEWLEEYKKNYQPPVKTTPSCQNKSIKPNAMQSQALESLKKLRDENKQKALLISATGTGKTYLSAFDVQSTSPKRMLFVVHRENIARNALESFKNVIPTKRFGLFTGNQKDDCDYLFATIQTIGKSEYYRKFKPDHFDYIIIDEAHRAGADSYQGLLNYFEPNFLLGMSATPERNDEFNIYSLFDHNIAYEIRLKQALEYDLICPFHYFGITDLIVNGQTLDDNAQFNLLTSPDRVDHIISNVEFYGHHGDKVRGLIFTSRNEEASDLSKLFNLRGYRTVALSGKSSKEDRENAIYRLELEECDNCLDYIFSVDIFNEGIDIPKVNQIVMLRPTQSAIIFVQQLGRGLRKTDNKDYVVVLDFIANYQRNYLIPLALSGDRSYNKDILRKTIITSKAFIPGYSSVSFDEISKKQIFQSIDRASFNNLATIKKEYLDLKYKLGKIPSIMDFYQNNGISPKVILEYTKNIKDTSQKKVRRNYHNFLKKIDKDYNSYLTNEQDYLLELISQFLVYDKRPHETSILKLLLENPAITIEDIEKYLWNNFKIKNEDQSIESSLHILSGGFFNNDHQRYAKYAPIEKSGSGSQMTFSPSHILLDSLQNQTFTNMVRSLILYNLELYKDKFHDNLNNSSFKITEKYTRRDVCRLLNWESDESSTIYGYRIKYNTLPIFITYHKKDEISSTTKYEDQFINKNIFSWYTRSKIKITHPDVKEIFNHEKNDLKIYIFVKKYDNEDATFYYLGRGKPLKESSKEVNIADKKGKIFPIVNIFFKLEQSVPDELYDYLTSAVE